ncbi:proline-rich receptor-like protein kinase PERK14 isoform X5 [Hevea brasiliensis]|uniref:proline-rich receptor-like protein kinase PERK14 isoform X5 n=1 Tax=Hevea brasiliensis TaxID=3981 RepID=UPI0025F11979|nr:proline-rich receptor-like protein kinase PERK14 isoform X5 [Hevea brasiliensis]
MGLCGLFNRKTNNDRRSTKDQQQVVQPGAVQEGRPQQTPSAQTTAPSSTKEQSELKPLGDGQTPLPFLENLPKFYTYEQLAKATGDFTNNNLIGVGGSGQVFRGELPDGKVVAIKKLKYTAGQAELEGAQAQFETEIKTNSSIRHRNLVEVIGYCSDKADQLFVCEFVPNKSLRYHLHGKEDKIINWPNRMKIAVGSAKGLAYLHEGCPKTIIHRDIKSENILLDHNFEPKVADFSLANFLPNTGDVNHITSILRGTNVYTDPEYGDIQRVSEKSDIYSFRVVLLELITGRKPLDKKGDTIVNWAKDRIGQALDDNECNDLVDSRLQEYNEEEMIRMICCAAASVYKPSHFRPIMKQIIKVLEGTMPHVKIMNWKDIETLQGRATTDLESVLGVERIQITPQKIFAYKELAMATGGFSNVNLLGEGGFGQVYKGTLSNGEVVAIKKLSLSSKQGEIEFLMEVGTLNRAHHQHLVKLIGYCVDRANRLLIYEFVPNNSLGNNLHGQDKVIINWPTRMKIAIGSAKGLAYLHEICNPKIIHRGINASNILLDHNFEPKISDFGIAKEFSNSSVTHMSTVVKGTFGYICPDYYLTQRLSDKTDVYSFGVVLLELITGKTPILREGNVASAGLTSWVRAQLKEVLDTDNYNNIVDVKLKNNYKKIEMIRMIHCAAACVYKPVKYRPKMSQIVEVLQGKLASESIWLSSDNTFLKDNYQLH